MQLKQLKNSHEEYNLQKKALKDNLKHYLNDLGVYNYTRVKIENNLILLISQKEYSSELIDKIEKDNNIRLYRIRDTVEVNYHDENYPLILANGVKYRRIIYYFGV